MSSAERWHYVLGEEIEQVVVLASWPHYYVLHTNPGHSSNFRTISVFEPITASFFAFSNEDERHFAKVSRMLSSDFPSVVHIHVRCAKVISEGLLPYWLRKLPKTSQSRFMFSEFV